MPPIAMIAKKVGMTRIFESDGTIHPVTVLEAGPCKILKVKSAEGEDGYDALQLGFEPIKEKSLNKPQLGYFKKLGVSPYRFVREVRVDASVAAEYEAGQDITVDSFEPGEFIDVTANSKGRGFTGVMKRHAFHCSKEWGHGTHEYFRHGGSIGTRLTPGMVFKGKKMPGQYGNNRVTTQNLRIVKIDAERGLIFVHGAIPGANGGLVTVRKAVKKS